jgi:hypothetical protein
MPRRCPEAEAERTRGQRTRGDLRCRQNRKALARMAKIEVRDIRFGRHDRSNARNQRPLSARLDHSADRISGTNKESFDRTVAAIPDPAGKASRRGCLCDPGAEADALNSPAHDHPAQGSISRAHRISPLSGDRAELNPEQDQRASSLI